MATTVRATRIILLAMALVGAMAEMAPATSYYVNSIAGDDHAEGTSPSTAWQTLDRVNQQTFQPGDWILFREGSRFAGRLAPQGSGTAARPIHIDMFGTGALPRIDGGGRFGEALLIRNQNDWTVRNLELTNLGPTRAAFRAGARVLNDQIGEMVQIRLSDLYVHDVNGNLTKSQRGTGIVIETAGDRENHFNGVLVERCHIVHVDRDGITQHCPGSSKSPNIVFRYNLVEDVGGDPIKAWGSIDGLIEKNVVRGGGLRAPDASAGIWPFGSDHTIIQYNEVSGMRGPSDAEGYDCDYDCRNSVIQYNYSHDNIGGFLLVCAPAGKPNDGSIIRYNVSQDDGTPTYRVINIAGNVTNTRIYNNTIFVSRYQNVPLINFHNWSGGVPKNTWFANNLFYVAGRVTYNFNAKQVATVFDHNLFYFAQSNQQTPPGNVILSRPLLRSPGVASAGFGSVGNYAWQQGANSPEGLRVPGDDSAWDILGRPITPAVRPFIGAIRPN